MTFWDFLYLIVVAIMGCAAGSMFTFGFLTWKAYTSFIAMQEEEMKKQHEATQEFFNPGNGGMSA